MSATYTIERWPLGWLLCGADGRSGIPIDAFTECLPLFPKVAVMDAAIVHHLRQSGHWKAVACILTTAGGAQWREQIRASLTGLPPQERWWKGLDVGTSSAALFAVFCEPRWKCAADEMGRGSTPLDADDFGRCKRLLDLFPEWRAKLSDVAVAYPNDLWPKLIARWEEIESAEPRRQSEILRTL